VKHAFIQACSAACSIVRLCEVMEVSTSGFHDWLGRPESHWALNNHQITAKTHCYHQVSKQIYGSPRIHKGLAEQGESASIHRVHRVARLLRREGIVSKLTKQLVITTNSKNPHTQAPDNLNRRFKVHKPNGVWISDATFIPTR
jgi:transposase InsO family protein